MIEKNITKFHEGGNPEGMPLTEENEVIFNLHSFTSCQSCLKKKHIVQCTYGFSNSVSLILGLILLVTVFSANKSDTEFSPSRLRVNRYITMVTAKKPPGDIQAKPRTLPGRFGREKRIKYF